MLWGILRKVCRGCRRFLWCLCLRWCFYVWRDLKSGTEEVEYVLVAPIASGDRPKNVDDVVNEDEALSEAKMPLDVPLKIGLKVFLVSRVLAT